MVSVSFDILESLMLICFGSSWPFAIIRSWRSKSTAGVSIVFLSLILLGYVFGITCKLLQQPDPVIWLYGINSAMIFTEMILYFRYRKRSDCHSDNNALEKVCPPVCFPS